MSFTDDRSLSCGCTSPTYVLGPSNLAHQSSKSQTSLQSIETANEQLSVVNIFRHILKPCLGPRTLLTFHLLYVISQQIQHMVYHVQLTTALKVKHISRVGPVYASRPICGSRDVAISSVAGLPSDDSRLHLVPRTWYLYTHVFIYIYMHILYI